jgi:hypothetical protein
MNIIEEALKQLREDNVIKLFHIQKFLPNEVINVCLYLEKVTTGYFLSEHMKKHINSPDFKHAITEDKIYDCLNKLKSSPVKPFEVELNIDNNHKQYTVTKWVVRVSYNDNKDISIAVRGHKVVTAWLNDKNDVHSTLDLDKYADSIF